MKRRKSATEDPARTGEAIPDLQRAAPGPEAARIFAYLRDRILSGALRAGVQMGSAPQIAREMDVSRAAARKALDQLIAEGYLERGDRGSLSVAAGALLRTPPAQDFSAPASTFVPFRFDLIDFRPGVPDLSLFPSRLWQRMAGEAWRQMTPLDLSYSQPEGRSELRREIARHLTACRGVKCQPEQIVVTSGSTQALGIIGKILLRGARRVCIMEDPGPADSRRILAGAGGRIVPVTADEQGLVTETLPGGVRPALVHVTPSHQFPLGGTMPVQRRVQLLSYARKHSALVVEEDYDGDFRYDSPRVSSIQGLLPSRVIYVGTFSMTLFPSLRVGYVVVPPALIAVTRNAKRSADFHTATLEQLVLARLMKKGYFARHVEAMERNYRKSRVLLLEALQRHFGGEAHILGASSGLHICARFPGVRFTPTLLNRIDLAGVGVYPVEDHAVRKGRWEDTVILGFGMLDDRRINTGIAILKRCLPGF